jgi:hypothetical protein
LVAHEYRDSVALVAAPFDSEYATSVS